MLKSFNKYYFLILLGGALSITGSFLGIYNYSAYTIPAILLSTLLPPISHMVILGVLVFISGLLFKKIRSLRLALFAWLFFLASIITAGGGAYQHFVLYPEMRQVLSDLSNKQNK